MWEKRSKGQHGMLSPLPAVANVKGTPSLNVDADVMHAK